MASAIATRYAAALEQVLAKPGAAQTLESALPQLQAVGASLRDSEELRNVFASPAVAQAQKKKLAAAIGERLGVGGPVRNLLFVLIDHRRMASFSEVVEAYAEALDRRRGVARIRVASAMPMPADQQNQILEKFRGITGRTVEADFETDESLLGGSVARVGGKVYDGSLRSQLAALDRMMAGD